MAISYISGRGRFWLLLICYHDCDRRPILQTASSVLKRSVFSSSRTGTKEQATLSNTALIDTNNLFFGDCTPWASNWRIWESRCWNGSLQLGCHCAAHSTSILWFALPKDRGLHPHPKLCTVTANLYRLRLPGLWLWWGFDKVFESRLASTNTSQDQRKHEKTTAQPFCELPFETGNSNHSLPIAST